MKRFSIGALTFGFILAVCSERSTPACLIAGALATFLMLQLGARSIVEKVGALLTAGSIAWLAGPRAAAGQSLFDHFFAWIVASTTIAIIFHPRAE